jgi:hypothetical protein
LVAQGAADGEEEGERGDVVAERREIVGQVVAGRGERQANGQETCPPLPGEQQAGDPTRGKGLAEPDQAEHQVQGKHRTRGGQREAEGQGVEAPHRRNNRCKQGSKTLILKPARQAQQQRVVLEQAPRRNRQPPHQHEQDEVERAVAGAV